jgi:hypothetical protein
MGYKIWQKDKSGWSLAFDTIYESLEKVTERIAELNAIYHDKIKYNEIAFASYLDYIRLAKDGSIIDAPKMRPIRRNKKSGVKYSVG